MAMGKRSDSARLYRHVFKPLASAPATGPEPPGTTQEDRRSAPVILYRVIASGRPFMS